MNPQDQSSGHNRDGHEFKPDHTAAPQPAPAPASGGSQSLSPAVPAPPSPDEKSLYHSDSGAAPDGSAPMPMEPQMHDNGREVVWTASEFVAHDKTPAWFAGLVGGALVLAGLVYFITRDLINTSVVIVAAIIFGVAGARPPRQMEYGVNDHGIGIGRRFYPYTDFRSFSIVDEGALRSIVFMPLKRFMPILTIYYDPADEQRIGDVLFSHLPMHEHKHDLTERIMRRLRF